MARPIKEGLNYFPLDVDVFDDPKILFVADRFDSKGEIITIKLLCWIYRNGYYCQWDDEHALIFAKKNFASIKAGLCQDVVSELLKRGFFHEGIFESFGVLTSRAIQQRWQNVITGLKRKAEIIPELSLLTQEETPVIPEETLPKQEVSTQRKGKEKKGEERKEHIPSLEEVKEYFTENGYDPEAGERAFHLYQESVNGTKRRMWRDTRGNPIKNWKMKMRSVWFKDENKLNSILDDNPYR